MNTLPSIEAVRGPQKETATTWCPLSSRCHGVCRSPRNGGPLQAACMSTRVTGHLLLQKFEHLQCASEPGAPHSAYLYDKFSCHRAGGRGHGGPGFITRRLAAGAPSVRSLHPAVGGSAAGRGLHDCGRPGRALDVGAGGSSRLRVSESSTSRTLKAATGSCTRERAVSAGRHAAAAAAKAPDAHAFASPTASNSQAQGSGCRTSCGGCCSRRT